MKYDYLETIKFIYESDNTPVLLLDNNYNMLWHSSHPMPFDISGSIPDILGLPDGAPPVSGDYSYILDGFIYTYHVISLPDKNFLISLSSISEYEKAMNNALIRRSTQSQINSGLAIISSIAGSSSELNDLFEGGDEVDRIWDDACSQLNNIMCRCASMIKTYRTVKELTDYFDLKVKHDSTINIGVFMEKFACASRLVTGPRSNITFNVNAESNLFADVSEERMEMFMLCLMIIARGNTDIPCTVTIDAFRSPEENVIISLTAAMDASYKAAEATERELLEIQTERLIIKKFSNCFCRNFSDISTTGKRTIKMEFESSKNIPRFELKAPPENEGESIITPYHALLSDMTDFRYY